MPGDIVGKREALIVIRILAKWTCSIERLSVRALSRLSLKNHLSNRSLDVALRIIVHVIDGKLSVGTRADCTSVPIWKRSGFYSDL